MLRLQRSLDRSKGSTAPSAVTTMLGNHLAHVGNIPQQDSAERAFNKLARTFAVQMEALKQRQFPDRP
jgi:hypothetical protein